DQKAIVIQESRMAGLTILPAMMQPALVIAEGMEDEPHILFRHFPVMLVISSCVGPDISPVHQGIPAQKHLVVELGTDTFCPFFKELLFSPVQDRFHFG